MDKKILITTILFLITVTGSLCSPSPWTGVTSLNNIYNDDACGNTQFSCVNCTAVRLCTQLWNGTFVQLAEFNCTGNTPYCDFTTGSCSPNLPADYCAPVDPSFFCSGDGYFPNPTNCQKYYSCIKGTAYSLECTGFYYDSRSETCQNPHPCYTVDCTANNGIRVPFPGNYEYFAFCLEGSVFQFGKCPGQFQFDVTAQDCIPVCNWPGRQGDPFDCTKYYKCSYAETNDNLTLIHFTCPEGELYDALNSRCIPKVPGVLCESGKMYTGNKRYIKKK